jgi:hypothetical protein
VGELGRCTAWFLGNAATIAARSSDTVVVNRNNNTAELVAVAITVTASAGADTATTGTVLLQEDGTLAEQSVNDGSPGDNSVRFAAGFSGLATAPSVGANTTSLVSQVITSISYVAARETTAGQGARSIGFSDGTSDDRAFVHLAVKQLGIPATATPSTVAVTVGFPTPTVIATPINATTTPSTVAISASLLAPAIHAVSPNGIVPALTIQLDPGGFTIGYALDDPATVLDIAQLGPLDPTFPNNITERVREASIQRGAQRELQRIEAGTGTLVADNRDGYFTNLEPMRRIRITGSWSGVDFPVFQGFIESVPIHFPGDTDTETQIGLVDGMKMLSLAFVSGNFIQQGSGARIATILDAVAWPAAERDLDTGTATVPAITLTNMSALEHIQQIAHAEGGRFFIGKDGAAVFREAVEVNPDLSTRTWTDDGTGMTYRDVSLVRGDDLILNDVHLTRIGGVEQVAEDLFSQAEFGLRSVSETDIQLASDGAVLSRAELQVSRYASPVLRLESLVDDAMQHGLWDQVLARDINDIVQVLESRTATAQVSSVEGIAHSIGRDGSWTVTLNVAPSALVSAGILDDATYGLLDSTAILG